jgi:hypothetical protein
MSVHNEGDVNFKGGAQCVPLIYFFEFGASTKQRRHCQSAKGLAGIDEFENELNGRLSLLAWLPGFEGFGYSN